MFNVAIDQLLARLCAPAQSFPPECVLAVQFMPVLLDCLAHLQARPVSIIHPTILRRLTFVLLLHARLFRVTHPSPPDLPAQPSICVGNCVLFSFTFILSLATGRFLACHFFISPYIRLGFLLLSRRPNHQSGSRPIIACACIP